MKTGWFTPTDFSLDINCLEHISLLGPPKGRVKKAALRGGMTEPPIRERPLVWEFPPLWKTITYHP